MFLNLKMFLAYIVPRVKLPVRTLTLTSSAFATPVQSGKNIISEMALLLCTSARMAKPLEKEIRNKDNKQLTTCILPVTIIPKLSDFSFFNYGYWVNSIIDMINPKF